MNASNTNIEYESNKVGSAELKPGMSVHIPSNDTTPGVTISPTEVDENGGIFAKAIVHFAEWLGENVPEEASNRMLHFRSGERRITASKPINLEEHEVREPGDNNNRKIYIVGAVVATAATGIIVRRIKNTP